MTEQSSNQPFAPDYEQLAHTLQEITTKSQELLSEFLRQE